MADKIVGIQTVPREVVITNYGSLFQHYALRRVLSRLGYKSFRCEIERVSSERGLITFPFHFIKLCFRALLKRDFSVARNYFWQWKTRCLFIYDYRSLIGRVFEEQDPKGVSAYIAGSDSVWCCTSDRMFMLDDKRRDIKKISYAASSAWDKFGRDLEWRKCIRGVLDSYTAISVRETVGEKALKSVDESVRVDVVVDPVLLLHPSEWQALCSNVGSKTFKRKTILYYAVNAQSSDDLDVVSINQAACLLGCEMKAIGIQGAQKFIPPKYLLHPSPTLFLSMMRDAEYVVTNSFHGVVFSIIMGKKFAFVQQRSHVYGNQNTRQQELLSQLFLEDRVVYGAPTAESITNVLNKEIDYKRVHALLDSERTRCINWLKEALS